MSETLLLVLCFTFITQSSALWNSIILVFMSILMLYLTFFSEGYSPMLIMIMLFVGGLLILLAFVCSMANNDVISMVQPILITLSVTWLIIFMDREIPLQSSWFINLSPFASFYMDIMAMFCSLIILILAFLLLSTLMLEYSGMVRQI